MPPVRQWPQLNSGTQGIASSTWLLRQTIEIERMLYMLS
jgi:hypothetical protein